MQPLPPWPIDGKKQEARKALLLHGPLSVFLVAGFIVLAYLDSQSPLLRLELGALACLLTSVYTLSQAVGAWANFKGQAAL